MGRPHSLTPARHLSIVTQLQRGAYYQTAARFAGIHPATLQTWITRGFNEQQRIANGTTPSETEAPFLALHEDVQEAQAQAELHAIDEWRKQIPEDWRAAKDFLARRFPERWANNQERGQVTVNRDDSMGPVTAIVTADAERLADIVRAVIDRHVPVAERDAAVETVRGLMLALPVADDAQALPSGTETP